MVLPEIVDKNFLVRLEKHRPYICSPGSELPIPIVLDVDKTSSAAFLWEVRLKDYIPRVDIQLTKINRKYDNKGSDHSNRFLIPKTIIIPEMGDMTCRAKHEIVSSCKIMLAISGYVMPGIYFMHFAAKYFSERMTGEFEFEQKLQIIKPSLRK